MDDQDDMEKMLSRTVLILDDDEDIVEVIADRVDELGFQSLVETDPWRALKVLKRKKVGLVISDYKMPGLSGWEFYQVLKVLDSAPKIAYVTGFASELPAEILDDAKVTVVNKPFTAKEIDRILKVYMD